MAHAVLDIIPEDIEKPHIAEQVQNTAMQEHGSEDRHKTRGIKEGSLLLLKETQGNEAMQHDKVLKTGAKLVFIGKAEDIDDNQPGIDDGKLLGGDIISERKHGG